MAVLEGIDLNVCRKTELVAYSRKVESGVPTTGVHV